MLLPFSKLIKHAPKTFAEFGISDIRMIFIFLSEMAGTSLHTRQKRCISQIPKQIHLNKGFSLNVVI